MDKNKFITRESTDWVREGIITAEQQAQILALYPLPTKKSGNPLLVFFSVIGFLLIGSGIILIFATNWWRLPLPVKLAIGFVPLLAAQAFCLFITLKSGILTSKGSIANMKYGSVPFREGAATFLSLSFFAALALISQVFHSYNDLQLYFLICGLLTLPAAYFYGSIAAFTISVGCALASPFYGVFFLLTAPFFYFNFKKGSQKSLNTYLLILFSALSLRTAFEYLPSEEMLLFTCIALLLIDSAYRLISPDYFRTPAKALGCAAIILSICVSGVDFNDGNFLMQSSDFEIPIAAILAFLGYGTLRYFKWYGFIAADFLAVSLLVLTFSFSMEGIAANILMLLLGVLFIVWGSKNYRINYLNLGMFFLLALIGIRFFDSSLSLLVRGIAFVLLGIGFLAVNIIITRKWKTHEIPNEN